MRRIINFLMSLRRQSSKEVYLTRHGESEFNAAQRVGGDPALSPNGIKYSNQLRKFFLIEQRENEMKQVILSSTLQRAKHTADIIADEQV
jgi:6-phosphofructo-2-kinase/fructose-2,6-biphosphatase 2